MQPPPLVLVRPEDRQTAFRAAAARAAAERLRLDAQAADAAGRHDDAVALLRQAAEGGDAVAMSFLGARLLIGRAAPLEPRTALALLARAAELDQADAHTILATVGAASAVTAEQWARALDHLERAADLGSTRAQGQLRLLSGHAGPVDSGAWGRMRRGVDWAAWTRPPPKRVLSEAPRLRAVDGFLSGEVCDWLVARAQPLLKPASVYDPATGAARTEQARSNSAVEFDIVNADVVMMLVRGRLGAATHLPTAAMEPLQVLYYQVGQRFERHFDFLDPAVEGYARDAAARGQRIATFLIYLNDDYEGGETEFPLVGLRHRGRKGDALYFANVDAANRPDRRTLHAGAAPTAGVKWLLSQWIRDHAAPLPGAAAPTA